jgi:glycosyltransferase involved in cell wall biosynthesis
MNKSSLKKGQPALIVSSAASEWLSCAVITPNLQKAYESAFGTSYNLFEYDTKAKLVNLWQLARRIVEARPDRIVFLDHCQYLHELIEAVFAQYQSRAVPPIYIHVYGDFTLYPRLWLRSESLLKSREVKWICASDRQALLVSRFLVNPCAEIRVCPFPVDTNLYFFDPKEREEQRDVLGLRKDDIAVFYAGRLSTQKNSIALLNHLEKVQSLTHLSLRLFLAGTFDDLGAPFFGLHLKSGAFYQQWSEALNRLSPAFRKSVRYLGHLSGVDLRKNYAAADFYTSLSMHHDEDFGMGPAEALCSGTPLILSDWGGYSSMNKSTGKMDFSCQLVPTQITATGLQISVNRFRNSVLNISNEIAQGNENNKVKLERSGRNAERFSIPSVGRLLSSIHQEECESFRGFNDRMRILERFGRDRVLFQSGPCAGTFYEDVYGAYVSP